MVPVVRKMQRAVVESQTLSGEKRTLSLTGRELTVFLHRASEKNRPVLFEFHGGGYVFGSAAADDNLCETLKDLANCNVIGVDYRLAPEHRFPAQKNDAVEAIDYFRTHAEEFSLDMRKVAVMGFSAGANLAATAALTVAGRGDTFLKAQILHYPFLDYTAKIEDLEGFDADIDPLLMKGFDLSYCEEAEWSDPFVSPVLAGEELLKNAAPALIIAASRDSLQRDAKLYHERLKNAGAESVFRLAKDAHHCYIEDTYNDELYEKTTLEQTKALHSPDFRERARESLEETAAFLQAHF